MKAETILCVPVLLSPYLSGAYENQASMISQRGDDMELILGQGLATGYESHTSTKVNYFLPSLSPSGCLKRPQARLPDKAELQGYGNNYIGFFATLRF